MKSILPAGNKWLLQRGFSIEKLLSLCLCLNCDHILSGEHTTRLEEYLEGENGNFIVIRAESDVEIQVIASALHQSTSGELHQQIILLVQE